MNGNESEKSFGELPTWGREESSKPEVAAEGQSWSERELSRAETLRPPEGIRDDGRTDAARRWTPGETILDRYVVEQELGQGGMGVVYGGLDRVGGVRVAVKCLPPELSHNSVEMEEVRENFQLVYGLSHPNIAGARYLERDGSGVYYLVMEEAFGENLRRWLRAKWKAGGVTVAEAVPILRQVASALDYAHGEKVVHRDVKPGNVMIDARGRVKVLDFGLASQIRTSLSRASHANRGTSGTGPYMAPEQWRGRRQDGKTDQYALGVMAYEMLAGHLPFENDEVSVLREVVLKEEPEDIPGMPEGAMAAIRRAMSKNATDRFPSCNVFVSALESASSQGRASTPCEPGKGPAAGTTAGKSGGKPAGTTARSESSPHQETADAERALREAEARAEAERKARKKAEAEAREARWKARAEELAAQRAQEARGRAAGWTWFLALVLVVGGLAAYGWWQQEQERSQAQVQLFQQEVEVSRRAQQEAERKAEEARQKLAEAPVKGEPGEGGKGDARLMGEGNALVEAARLEGSPLQGSRAGDRTTVRVGVREVALRWCPAGTFTMGSPEREEGRGDDETQHRVTLTRGFWMGETEVTQGLWGEVMGKNPLVFKSGDNYPMESVSWEDCQKFVQALNSRYPQEGLRWALPTEAQWEYACRAGRGTAYSWGNALNGDKANCNGKYPCGTTVKGPYKKKTTPVGSYDPNAWGLYDMHGNVWEWCVDWYDSGYYAKTPRANPKGPISGADRVLRGGGFWNDPRGCRAAIRGGGHLGDRSRGRGFRPVARQD